MLVEFPIHGYSSNIYSNSNFNNNFNKTDLYLVSTYQTVVLDILIQ